MGTHQQLVRISWDMLLQVCVPDGLLSGDLFTCEAEGQSFDVSVPEGCCGGQVLEVDLPVVQETPSCQDMPLGDVLAEASPGMTLVELVVPEECYPGMEFCVQWGENEFTLAVPEGCEPGQLISVELPVIEDPPVGMPRSRKNSSYSLDTQQAYEEQAALQQQQQALELQLALQEHQLPAQAQLDVRGARTALPSGGKFFTGQVLEVMRSDGSWSNVRRPPPSPPHYPPTSRAHNAQHGQHAPPALRSSPAEPRPCSPAAGQNSRLGGRRGHLHGHPRGQWDDQVVRYVETTARMAGQQ